MGVINETVGQVSNRRLVHREGITPHVARTLRAWRERFLERPPAVRGQGFAEEVIPMWGFDLGYCEAGFLERDLGDVPMTLAGLAARETC